jgi:hypothetical protein
VGWGGTPGCVLVALGRTLGCVAVARTAVGAGVCATNWRQASVTHKHTISRERILTEFFIASLPEYKIVPLNRFDRVSGLCCPQNRADPFDLDIPKISIYNVITDNKNIGDYNINTSNRSDEVPDAKIPA